MSRTIYFYTCRGSSSLLQTLMCGHNSFTIFIYRIECCLLINFKDVYLFLNWLPFMQNIRPVFIVWAWMIVLDVLCKPTQLKWFAEYMTCWRLISEYVLHLTVLMREVDVCYNSMNHNFNTQKINILWKLWEVKIDIVRVLVLRAAQDAS